MLKNLLRRKTAFFLLLSTVLILSVGTAFAQVSVQQATKEVDRPVRQEIKKKVIVAPEEIPPPEEEKELEKLEGHKFLIKKIHLSGFESFTLEDLKPLLEPYEDKELTLGELKQLAKKIEKFYLREGIIAACFVPPQEIKNGTVELQIVESKMGELEIKKHRHFKNKRLAYYWRIKPNEVLRYNKMNRSLQLMNKNPDRQVKATLLAGERKETTDVYLDVESKIPIHLTSTFDREGSVATGIERHGVGIRHNNFLGLDDTLIGGYSYGKDFSGKYVYHILPISPVGTSIMYGFSDSKSTPKKQFTANGLSSRAQNSSFIVYQDIFSKNEYLGEVHFGLDVKDKTTTSNTGTLNRDRLRILRSGGSFVRRGVRNSLSGNFEISQGILGLGAVKRNPLTTRNAESDFTKFNASFLFKRMLLWRMEGILKLETQVASTALTPQEELYLGGIDSVRGYPAGDFLADSGVQTNLEVLIPAFFIPEKLRLPFDEKALKDNLTLVLFFDYGHGRRRSPTSTEKNIADLKSYGCGVRLKLLKRAFLRLEWGFPIGDKSITEAANARFHFSVDFES